MSTHTVEYLGLLRKQYFRRRHITISRYFVILKVSGTQSLNNEKERERDWEREILIERPKVRQISLSLYRCATETLYTNSSIRNSVSPTAFSLREWSIVNLLIITVKKGGTKYALFVVIFPNSDLNDIKQAIFCSFTRDTKVTHQVLNTFYESLLLHDPSRVSGKTGIICINVLVHSIMCKKFLDTRFILNVTGVNGKYWAPVQDITLHSRHLIYIQFANWSFTTIYAVKPEVASLCGYTCFSKEI